MLFYVHFIIIAFSLKFLKFISLFSIIFNFQHLPYHSFSFPLPLLIFVILLFPQKRTCQENCIASVFITLSLTYLFAHNKNWVIYLYEMIEGSCSFIYLPLSLYHFFQISFHPSIRRVYTLVSF
jgi:hypothetical protein